MAQLITIRKSSEFPATKSEISEVATSIVSILNEGIMDAAKFELLLKSMEMAIGEAREKAKSQIIEELEKNGGKLTSKGCRVELAKKTTYDYKPCEDEVLNALYADLEKTKMLIKNREEVLRIGITPDGEVSNKPHFSTSYYTKCTFPK